MKSGGGATAFGRLRKSVVAVAGRIGDHAWRWHRRNALYREMLDLDDRILAEIGVTRADVPDLVSRSYQRPFGVERPVP